MSDLANSCEYLTVDMVCSAVLDSEKAKANRQAKCKDEEKNSCCYICQLRPQCPIKCQYLGNTEKESTVPTKQTAIEITVNNKKPQEEPTKDNPICSSCYQEMSQTKTQLKIGSWKGPEPKLNKSSENKESLPVLVYLCPQCGKIELKLDESQ